MAKTKFEERASRFDNASKPEVKNETSEKTSLVEEKKVSKPAKAKVAPVTEPTAPLDIAKDEVKTSADVNLGSVTATFRLPVSTVNELDAFVARSILAGKKRTKSEVLATALEQYFQRNS